VKTAMESLYPITATERDRWIVAQRPDRSQLDPQRPYAFFLEDEYTAEATIIPIATVLLTNRECPWRCVMCDLWRNTLTETVPAGAIPAQIDVALANLPPARVIKLYNSGSFFDQRAIPVDDYPAIAKRLKDFERVIVECHPSLVGERLFAFRDLLKGRLEIAMGLETAHPEVLGRLNKRMTLEQFAEAADFLHVNGIDLRAFILVQPPFIKPDEALYWAERSLDFAFACDATAASLIPTRGGNGAMETLAASGQFVIPQLALIEDAMSYGLRLRRGRVFVDLWDLQKGSECSQCFAARVDRLQSMNLSQLDRNVVACDLCGGRS
jgi:radical SAM enzyme (TIGR01210 family)